MAILLAAIVLFVHGLAADRGTIVVALGRGDRCNPEENALVTTRRRGGRLAAFLLISALVLPLALFVGTVIPPLRLASCDGLGYLRVDFIARPCARLIDARIAFAGGQRAMANRQYRAALTEFRAATAIAPDAPWTHLAQGEVAEALAEYDEALAAYARAAALSGSFEASFREASLAARVGQNERAIRIIERLQPGWVSSRASAVGTGAAIGFVCVASSLSAPAQILECPALIGRVASATVEQSRQAMPQVLLAILFDMGDHTRALAFARSRGWVTPERGWCAARNQSVLSGETLAQLAIVMDPSRADCALPVAAGLANDGLARRSRLMLLDRIRRSSDAATRESAQRFVRYRLPDHDVPVIAESLNITASTLRHSLPQPDEAIATFKKAIDADPRFSWPYHNIAKVYMDRNDYRTARVWLEKTLTVNPDHWRAMMSYGTTLAGLAEYPAALAVYRRAAAITPDDALVHASIGWTLDRLGQAAEAEREMRLALTLDPQQKDARQYLNVRYGHDVRMGVTPGTAR